MGCTRRSLKTACTAPTSSAETFKLVSRARPSSAHNRGSRVILDADEHDAVACSPCLHMRGAGEAMLLPQRRPKLSLARVATCPEASQCSEPRGAALVSGCSC